MTATTRCASCGYTVLTKGDTKGWKAVQVDPDVAQLQWFCMIKEPCVDAFEAAVQQATENWQSRYAENIIYAEPEPDPELQSEAEPAPDLADISDRVVPIDDDGPGWLTAVEEN